MPDERGFPARFSFIMSSEPATTGLKVFKDWTYTFDMSNIIAMKTYVTIPSTDTRLRAKLFRGLSDPARLSLVETLRHGPHTVTELVEWTGLAQPNASKHLACLLDCGLVRVVREGRTATYYLVPAIDSLLTSADAVLQTVAPRIESCPNYEEMS